MEWWRALSLVSYRKGGLYLGYLCRGFLEFLVTPLLIRPVCLLIVLKKCYFWCHFLTMLVMVIVLTMVVSGTMLLAIVCNCVHCSLLFSSIFVLHLLRIKVYYINPGPVVRASSLLDTTHYNTKFIVPTVYR